MEQIDIELLLQVKKNITIFNSCMNEQKLNIDRKNVDCNDKTRNIVTSYIRYFDDEYIKQVQKDMECLLNNIDETLKEGCVHEIEEDYIDTYPEKSVKIYYCKNCLLTLRN